MRHLFSDSGIAFNFQQGVVGLGFRILWGFDMEALYAEG
jgi:hypothetical protein